MLKKAFLIKKDGQLVCSLCGKEYIKVRGHKAHELVNKEEPITEKDILYYTLEDTGKELKLDIHNNEKIIFTVFFNSSGILKSYGEENIEYWIELISQNFLYKNYENKERFLSFTDNENILINKYFKSLYKINNIGHLLKTLQKRKINYLNEDLSVFNKVQYGKIDLSVGNKYNKHENVAKIKLKEYLIGSNIFLEVIYAVGMVENSKIINPKKYRFFISKNFIYNPKGYDLSEIIGNKDIEIIYEQASLTQFNKKYPELMLNEFISSGGKDVVKFILANNNDPAYELIGKAKLGYIAECYEFSCNDFETNIKNLYKLSVKALRSLNTEEGSVFFHEEKEKIIEIYNRHPAIFSETIKKTGIDFLKNFNFNINLFDKNIVKYFRFINNLDMEDYQNYMDYMRMCRRHDLYPYGKFPKQIKIAHDMMVLYNNERLEAMRANNFNEAIEKESYTNLTYKTNDFEFLIPRSADDLVNESYQMRNCVRSYINRVAEGYTYIVFMRKKGRLSKSFVTIEVSKGYKLGQVKGVGNSRIDRITAETVMEWCDQKNIDYRFNWDLEIALDNAA